MPQFITRVDDQLAESVDELVTDGLVSNRSDAVRRALRQMVDQHRRSKMGNQIADACVLAPQTESELGWADAATEKTWISRRCPLWSLHDRIPWPARVA